MVLPALRHRLAPGEAPRRPAADVPPLARVLPHVAAGGRAAALVSVLARGDTAGPRPETLAGPGGGAGLGRRVEANLALAAHLARRCRESDDFEATPEEPELAVVCFRHLPRGRAAAARLGPAARARHPDPPPPG